MFINGTKQPLFHMLALADHKCVVIIRFINIRSFLSYYSKSADNLLIKYLLILASNADIKYNLIPIAFHITGSHSCLAYKSLSSPYSDSQVYPKRSINDKHAIID